LRVIHPKRFALRTANGLAQSSIRVVPREQQFVSLLELLGWDLEARAGLWLGSEPEFFQPEFVMDLGLNAGFYQSVLQRFRSGAIWKYCNS
jgi:hypothetical protein